METFEQEKQKRKLHHAQYNRQQLLKSKLETLTKTNYDKNTAKMQTEQQKSMCIMTTTTGRAERADCELVCAMAAVKSLDALSAFHTIEQHDSDQL